MTKLRINISILFIFVLMVSIYSCDKPTKNQKGTFFFAGICNDTILIFSDSRSSFTYTDGTIFAYFNNVSKIYQFHKTAMAMAGTSTFDSVYLKGIFKEFVAVQPDTISLPYFLDTFLDFARKRMPEKQFIELINNQFLICGYVEKKPTLIWHYKQEDSVYVGNGVYKTAAKITDNNPEFTKLLLTNNVENSVNKIAFSIEQMIKNENKDKVSHIGGNISILGLTKDRFNWIVQKNENDYYYQKQFFDAYKTNKMKMWYRSGHDSIEFRKLLVKEGFD